MTQISIRHSDLELSTSKSGKFGVFWIWARDANNEKVSIGGGYNFALILLRTERQFTRAARLVWLWQQIKVDAR